MTSPRFERAVVSRILRGLQRDPPLLQVLVGPRQVGKTTAARGVAGRWDGRVRYAAADEMLPPRADWIRFHWELARGEGGDRPALLVLDEVQKVPGWSEQVKALWDADRAARAGPRVLLLGSSALLLAAGTTESLAGRFFLHRCPHWSWTECRDAFGWDLDRWLWFGGYPGAAPLADDEDTWKAYVRDSLVEAVLARDVLSLQRVHKPALLRHLFALACHFPAQALSYTKMLGQLQEAGNTTTLAHYVHLLETAFLLSGLERWSPGQARSRGTSPKLVLWNNALVSALDTRGFAQARADRGWWGRLVENAVGAHLLNHLQGLPYEVCWWRERNAEVDFVVQTGREAWGIEVKSGRPDRRPDLTAFHRAHPRARTWIVGSGGMPLEEFFSRDPREVLSG